VLFVLRFFVFFGFCVFCCICVFVLGCVIVISAVEAARYKMTANFN
jgi:hypothetical protein